MTTREERRRRLNEEADRRILILDGAMGTMIQKHKLEEADFRGERFADYGSDLKGNNDLLTLTRPTIITDIHGAFLDAGADILETNTFNANAMSQSDYGLEDCVFELNFEAARLARTACDAYEAAHPGTVKWVAGAFGPTNRTASISPRVNDPGFRNVSFDALYDTYKESAKALYEGGIDIFLVETVFDTLNAKAAVMAIEDFLDEAEDDVPLMISGTITDKSGRTLSGQTAEAFWISLAHAEPFSIGLNCALGAEELRPHVEDLARVASTRVSVYPNAGLPNEFGEYDDTPDSMAATLTEFAEAGLVNIVGGCCGTTPDHIRAFAEALKTCAPRTVPELSPRLRLSGLEPFLAPA